MYCKTQWYIPYRVMIHKFYGIFCAHSIYSASASSRHLVQSWQYRPDQIKPIVHFIADMSQIEKMRLSIYHLPAIEQTFSHYQPQQFERGWYVMTEVNPTLSKPAHLMMSMISQITNMRLKVLPDIDHAIQFLTTVDNELVDRLHWGEAAD